MSRLCNRWLPPPWLQNPHNAKRIGWTVELRNIAEAIVYVTAHELGHLRFGPSERSAHAWGMRMLRRYRRRGLPAPLAADVLVRQGASRGRTVERRGV
jgi:hypothetical protein